MAEKGWGSTVKGWFIVDENADADGGDAPTANTAAQTDAATDDIIRRYAGGGGATPGASRAAAPPDLSPPRAHGSEAPPSFGVGGVAAPAVDGGKVDFEQVFRKAGISAEEADRVNKALSLLDQLPKETPAPVKQQIVETSLKAFGVPIESIIETACAEIQALHDSIDAGAAETSGLLEQSETRIRALEQEIADIRQVMTARKQEQRALEQVCRAQGLRVQQILEFFGKDKVGQVVHDSPRLVEPKG